MLECRRRPALIITLITYLSAARHAGTSSYEFCHFRHICFKMYMPMKNPTVHSHNIRSRSTIPMKLFTKRQPFINIKCIDVSRQPFYHILPLLTLTTDEEIRPVNHDVCVLCVAHCFRNTNTDNTGQKRDFGEKTRVFFC